MSLPDYFDRNAVAAAQAISGLDKERLAHQLDRVVVGVTLGSDADTAEGRALADLLVRLLARLYPKLTLKAPGARALLATMEDLASCINPNIETGGTPTVEVVIGNPRLTRSKATRIFAGTRSWDGRVSASQTLSCGDSSIPFGAGIAACLVAANIFRHIFLASPQLDSDATFSALENGELLKFRKRIRGSAGRIVLIGAGAIGNAAAWALSRTQMTGEVHIVDHERVDLGNLQRYVLTARSDVGAQKSELLAGKFQGPLSAVPFDTDLANYLQANGHVHQKMLLALDSARDRRAAQASLPKWVANAWTQPGDLGMSTHDFLNGACVSCLYLPEQAGHNEDQLIAEALGIPDRIMEVRTLLFRGEGTPRGLLDAIASARNVDIERLLPFEGRTVRSLYTDGFCGGAVIPLGQIGAPRADVHVPLAHQSAFAGILLAAAAVRHSLGGAKGSKITQLDVLKRLPMELTRPAAKPERQNCICQDADYRAAFDAKYSTVASQTTISVKTARVQKSV